MGKRVFMFPGQGSQYIGMGKDFYENFECAKKVFDKASEIRGGDVLRLDGHFIAVVSRNGDKLFTFDGNCNSTFRKSKTAYSIVNGELKGGKFLSGWHYMPPPDGKSASKKRGASAGK